MDEKNANALYQRACAHTRLGAESQAISDLELAISHAASLKDAAREEQDFEGLIGNERFEMLIESDETRPDSPETKS